MTESANLVALLRAEQDARWQLGDRVRIEHYLLLHPALEKDPAAVLDLIWNEMLLRVKQEEAPEWSEYARRFPSLAGRLSDLFRVLDAMRNASSTIAATGKVVSPAPEQAPLCPAGDDVCRVPGYEIVRELGRGGMGVVYEARHRVLRRRVALKMILAGLHADATARARFRIEAEAVARVQHPNVVQIYEIGEHEGRPYLCLEFVDGGSLAYKILGAPQPEQEAARLLETLARAVHHTHQRGILHRDLNPNNVLLTADGTPKITDFGLAKLVDAEAAMTQTQAFLGTPHYMAPEQAAGHAREVGAAADVYSLGAILYEMLTGHAPFGGETILETLEQVRFAEPAPPHRTRPELSPDLETICLKCLEKAPERRYASAEALADDLQRFLQGRPILARPVSSWRRLARSARRHPRLVAAALAAALLAGLLLTGGLYYRAKGQLAEHRAEDNYQRFVQKRNEAHFYGLLTGDQESLFVGSGDNRAAAEAAARDALALAGIDIESAETRPADLPAQRMEEVAADGYALVLLLAGLREFPAGTEAERRQQYQEALRLLDRASRFGLETRAYHLRRATFLRRLGDREAAKEEQARADALAPQGALDHFLEGEEQFRHHDWDAAAAAFERTVALRPDHFWAQFFLAVCHLKGERWETARAELNTCINLRPDFVWAYLFRSFAHEKLHALPDAEADFDKALKLNPNADARYVLYQTRGILRFNQGAFDQAAADFRAAAALKPAQYNAYLNLAHVSLAQGRFEEAEGQFNQALRRRPPGEFVFGYHLERGRQLLRNRQYEAAVAAADAARDAAPLRAEPDDVRGRAFLALKRYEEAEEAFDDFLRKGGEAGADVYKGRGQARMQLGKYLEAVEDYSRAVERQPDADIYQHRGWAHFFADAWKLAVRDFSRALELNPEAGDAYTGRGLARVMLGQYREAVADADAALRLRPDAPEMMHNLACLFAQAAVRVEADDAERDRRAWAETYRRRSVDAVRQTLLLLRPEQRPAFWRDKILPDAALAPVRDELRFKALYDELVRAGERK